LPETTTAAYVIASKYCRSINSSPGPFVAEAPWKITNKIKLLYYEVSELAHVLQSAGLDYLPVALLIKYWVYGKGIVAAIENLSSRYMQL